MNIYKLAQIHSRFLYSNKLDESILKDFKSYDKFKKIDDFTLDVFSSFLIESNYDIFLKISTNKGEFLFTNFSNSLNNEQFIEYLKSNSNHDETYYFANTDYYTYGAFGFAKDGKVERFLSFDEECSDEDKMVTWIGKAHSWEVETHTFYTKKKLQEMEMFFSSDEVCDMIDYYLPFLNEELNINEFTFYYKYDSNLEGIINSINPKYDKLDKKFLEKTYKFCDELDLNDFALTGWFNKQYFAISTAFLKEITNHVEDHKEDDILHFPIYASFDFDFKYLDIKFHNELLALLNLIHQAKICKLTEAIPYIKKFDTDKNTRFFIFVKSKSKNKMSLSITDGTNSIENININSSKKACKKILDKIKEFRRNKYENI